MMRAFCRQVMGAVKISFSEMIFMALLSPLLQEILVCPQCRGALLENETERTLTCTCGLVFSVGQDGIPNMLIDDARRVSDAPQSANGLAESTAPQTT